MIVGDHITIPLPGKLHIEWEGRTAPAGNEAIKTHIHPLAVANAPKQVTGYFCCTDSSALPNGNWSLHQVRVYYWTGNAHETNRMTEAFGLVKL